MVMGIFRPDVGGGGGETKQMEPGVNQELSDTSVIALTEEEAEERELRLRGIQEHCNRCMSVVTMCPCIKFM